MLEIAGLRKAFEGRSVLDGLDLSVAAGECVALLGANGSGKTTTLRCVAGLTIPDSGRIAIEGCDVVRDGAQARLRFSYMPQRSAFPPTLRVRESIGVVARVRDVTSARVESEIAACGLASCAESPVSALSGGQRQRLALALAFLPDVPLRLFDEPSANLDQGSLDVFHRRVRAFVRDGGAVLFTTHSRDDVVALASRVIRLERGRRVVDEGARRAWARRTPPDVRAPLPSSAARIETLAAQREASCAAVEWDVRSAAGRG